MLKSFEARRHRCDRQRRGAKLKNRFVVQALPVSYEDGASISGSGNNNR